MKKIISLFQRNYEGDRLVRDELVLGAEWVAAGEGVATVKFDGTSCLVRGGVLYRRYDAKNGKPAPVGFEPAQDPDPVTGHWPGWLPVSEGNPADRWHLEAFTGSESNGTYELVGPKAQGNPHRLAAHHLWMHGLEQIEAPRMFDDLREWFKGHAVEGIVWHHPDGRMVKIKRKDFGFKWPD